MPMIHTKRNYVMVGRASPDDQYVATYIMPQNEGRYLLTTQPIEQFETAVRWAMEMADFMAGPIEVLPIRSPDDLVRQIVEATGFEGVHAYSDLELQRAGRDLLVSIGVLPC